jgi:hypothetical protein
MRSFYRDEHELEELPVIVETVVYDGSEKVWRVLNVSTGTVYAGVHPSRESAERSIEEGELRAGYIVRHVPFRALSEMARQSAQTTQHEPAPARSSSRA